MISAQLNSKQVPLSELGQFLSHFGYNESYFSSNLSWVTCQLSINSESRRLFYDFHKINDCQIVGELGEWKLIDYDFKFLPFHLQQKPVVVTVKKSRLKKVIGLLNEDYKLDYFSRYGLFSGEVKYVPETSNWHIVGQLKNTRLNFDLVQQKHEQLIKSVDLKVTGRGRDFSLLANNIDVLDGLIQGKISYKYVDIDNKGILNAELDQLILSEQIQDAIFYGRTQFKDVVAKGSFEEGFLTLDAQMNSEQYQSNSVNAGPYRLELKVDRNKVSGEVLFQKIQFLDSLYKNSKYKIDKIISEAEFKKITIENSRLNYFFENGDYIWSFLGELSKDSAFNLIGFTKENQLVAELSFDISDSDILWQWEGLIGADFTLELKKLGDFKSTVNSLRALEKNLVGKASAVTSRPNLRLRYKDLIERARNILPFSNNN